MIETHYDAEAAVRLGRDVLAHEADAILAAADGAFVGSAFKKDGVFTGRIDEERVARFMQKAKALRKD